MAKAPESATKQPPKSIDLLLDQPCQRPGCPNFGKLRLQRVRRMGQPKRRRAIFLCGPCFESLHTYQLDDLFRRRGRSSGSKRSRNPSGLAAATHAAGSAKDGAVGATRLAPG